MLRFFKLFVGLNIPFKPRADAQQLRQLRNDPGMPRIITGDKEVKPRKPAETL